MKKLLFFALAVTFLISNTACKRTVEGESNKWNANKQTVEQMRAQYSNFGAAFDELLEKAEAKMSEAENASSKEQSIKMMAEANSIISSSFITKLKRIDNDIHDLEDLAAKAAQQSNDHSDSDAAWSAKTSADRAIRDARNSLSSAQVSSIAAAEGIVNSAAQSLERAKKRLQDVIKTAESKKDAEKKAEEDKKAAEDAAKAEEEKKQEPVKCGYCGTMNEPGATKCSSCGAPIEK